MYIKYFTKLVKFNFISFNYFPSFKTFTNSFKSPYTTGFGRTKKQYHSKLINSYPSVCVV